MSQQNINIPSVKFSNGIDFPLVGLGTFRVIKIFYDLFIC